jgi:hypothetical protein
VRYRDAARLSRPIPIHEPTSPGSVVRQNPGRRHRRCLEIAARHGCHPLRGVAIYEDLDKLTYVGGPSGILVMLAEELKNR